jgi:membrane fusion protein, multidrug efflux system
MVVRNYLQARLEARLGSMFRPLAIMLACVALVFGGLYGFMSFRSVMMKRFLATLANPPQTVSVAPAMIQDWRSTLTAIGSFRAANGADLALEASGVVEKIAFQSGDDVAAGQILLELRKDTDVAKLNSLKAAAELAALNLRRDQAQLKVRATSQAVVDNDQATLKSAAADVAQQEAIVAQKTLRAPFAGRLGIRQVDLGQYLSAGTTIVTLQALDPIYLDFALPQQALNALSVGQEIEAKVDAYGDERFKGKIIAISPKVDAASRNLPLRASVANPAARLRPGMFASAELSVGQPQRFVTLPQTAIVYAPFGNSVFLAQQSDSAAANGGGPAPALIAKQAFVRLGETRGDEVAVLEGVAEGASVVTAGQMKLVNGSPLNISKAASPTFEANPKPVDQ